jgi:hypothetical protein
MLKKEETGRFASIEEKKMEDPYSIKKCITTLEGLSDLQMEEMIKAAGIFKENPANREIFFFHFLVMKHGWDGCAKKLASKSKFMCAGKLHGLL